MIIYSMSMRVEIAINNLTLQMGDPVPKGGSGVGERGTEVEAPRGVWFGGHPLPTGEGSGEGVVHFCAFCSSNFEVRECLT